MIPPKTVDLAEHENDEMTEDIGEDDVVASEGEEDEAEEVDNDEDEDNVDSEDGNEDVPDYTIEATEEISEGTDEDSENEFDELLEKEPIPENQTNREISNDLETGQEQQTNNVNKIIGALIGIGICILV